MKFAEFLKYADKSIPQAADELSVTAEAVRFWSKGTKIPSEENMIAIFIWSGGLVQPNDFYSLPAEEVARANGLDPLPVTMEAAA